MKAPLLRCLLCLRFCARADGIDLLAEYPTHLEAGDTDPGRAREWEVGGRDVFRVSGFHLQPAEGLALDLGPADLGLGRSRDGAVWALILPRQGGTLASPAGGRESVAAVWLRFHPAQVRRLFPPASVEGGGATNLAGPMRIIAQNRLGSSWQAAGRALIPGLDDLTVDVDTTDGVRRFFVVDTVARTARYVEAFEKKAMVRTEGFSADAAVAAFDALWEEFDRSYAMFGLRPEVDWRRLRDTYRPRALNAASTLELAATCAEMLAPLRDLHVSLRVGGLEVPVFTRPRAGNANRSARSGLLGRVTRTGRVSWAATAGGTGYLAVDGWDDPAIPDQVDAALAALRETRGLVLDVRVNGGGSEPLAARVAGRFIAKEFVYGYSRRRNGSAHTNLTERAERVVGPAGPWRYDRPVVLLIGRRCMSSNESFIAMMSGSADVTTMGDRTCGSSGNPKSVRLPLGLTVGVPQWIDLRPDGSPLDERGLEPQIRFTPAAGAFDGPRDDLLLAALDRLRSVPKSEPSQP